VNEQLVLFVGSCCGKFQNFTLVPIRCSGIDLDDALLGFPVLQSNFSIRYLGLPFSIHRLCSGNFQYIVDKMASKLPIGKGNMSQPLEESLSYNPLLHPKLSILSPFCLFPMAF
jgi:hypothetical protein